VIDFGCKHGEWLSVCRDLGASRVLGLDQPKRIREGLLIAEEQFRVADLRQSVALDERFDLAICIEVAEHLPAQSALPLVRSLTEAAPVVLFSAALPDQGGHGHLNEQPRPYWNALFERFNFVPGDCVRPQIWQNPDVAWWYRQNLFLFCDDRHADHSPCLRAAMAVKRAGDLDLVHVDIIDRRRLISRAKSALRRIARR
jgi:hypothetical protein